MTLKSKLLIATSNPSKVRRFQKYLKGLDLNLLSLNDISKKIPIPKETANTCLQIAREKVIYYYNQAGLPCFSLDSGLYFEHIPQNKQPGKNVKGIAGCDDFMEPETVYSKMIEYYSTLAKTFGGNLKGYFLDAYCLYDGKKTYSTEVKRPITLTDLVYKKDVHFPICSLYKVKNKYYHELNEMEMEEFLKESITELKKLIFSWKKDL